MLHMRWEPTMLPMAPLSLWSRAAYCFECIGGRWLEHYIWYSDIQSGGHGNGWKKTVRLDPFSALVVVLSECLTVHFYTLVGVPVSTSQAVIGAVLGIGLVKGISTVSQRTLANILMGWFLTPAIACSIAVALYFIVHLKYIPG
jgi:PiT family inorganic phosphate transporter